jgi:GNAT superfamily N-acetyltransferase
LLADYIFNADENWPGAWIADSEGEIVGVLLTGKEWLDDLWIESSHRRLGIGTRLLAIAEREISSRGHEVGRLRLATENARARRFYVSHGWVEASRYRHEIYGFEMIEMTKRLGPPYGNGGTIDF